MKKFLLVCFSFMFVLSAWAQDRVINGKVTSSEDGSTLPGVNVVMKGTTNGSVTDGNGNYKLSVPNSGGVLSFSFIGFLTREVEIGSKSTIDIQLESDVQQLSEVVVSAGGLIVQKKELGNFTTTVKASDITAGKTSNAVAGLQGKVPGLLISAVSSGVNPNYRVVLRGQRSLLGNNQALLVLDNVITPSNVLGNLNPEDIEDIQVLNGAGAAALYGSDASNGALIVTTKRGKSGKTEIKVAQTTTFETVSYLPQLQTKFGSGTTPDTPPSYTPYENQQYGPRFDGTMRIIGKPLADGSIQTVPYSYSKEGKNEFWETGNQNQTDLSFSSGDEKGNIYAAAQYFKQNSTVPWDTYNRYSFRVNTDRNIGNSVKVAVSVNYIASNTDVSSQAGNAFTNVLMSPSQVPLTRYKNWRTNPFANPNGYYNEYFDNPYYTLENNRSLTKNNYLQASMELKWNPIKPLTFTSRLGLSGRDVFNKVTSGKFEYSDYTRSISGGSKTNDIGAVSDFGQKTNQLVVDLLAEYKANFSDFSLKAVGGFQSRDNTSNQIFVGVNGLVVSGVYNVSNTLTNLGGGQFGSHYSQFGVYGDVRLGYKDFAFIHTTMRNDWRSVLAKENRSFFYPAVDASLIVTEMIPALKSVDWLGQLKVRGGYSQVGQVNIDPYSLNTTFFQNYGYPYASGGGFSLGNNLVAAGLKPEITTSVEAGFDLDLNKYLASIGMTYYKSNTVDQTIPVQVPSSTGFSTLLTNVGEVENRGIETYIRATPIETSYGLSVFMQATYTLARNKVISLSDQSDLLILPGGVGNARIVAKVGQPFPFLQVTEYKRTSEGQIIVDANTGYPSTDGSYHDVGTTAPPHIVGLTSTISYKGFKLSGTAEFRTGHYLYNSITTAFDFSGAGIRNTWYNRERFVVPNSVYADPENDGAYIQNTNVTTSTGGADFWTDGSRNTGIGENFTHSAGFWKIREISLRYDFPAAWLGATKYIKGASLSIQGRNLFIWVPKTNLYTDPEYSANGADSNAVGFTNINLTPPARYVGGTISLTF
jgi:TonB-linked SusC/RagA family outer membrane protein